MEDVKARGLRLCQLCSIIFFIAIEFSLNAMNAFYGVASVVLVNISADGFDKRITSELSL